MKIGALWSALRGHPHQPEDQEKAQQQERRRIPPCSLEEMDARLQALDEFIHDKDTKRVLSRQDQIPTHRAEDSRKDPNALRTWFVLKSLNDEEKKSG